VTTFDPPGYPPDDVGGPGRAHPNCWDAAAHRYDHDVGGCARPGDRTRCYDADRTGCTERPGTAWGPYWCPRHDAERLNRISRQLDAVRRTFGDLERETRRP
jgi:hypothetical protein